VREDVVFAFPGQGPYWPGTARELLTTSQVFRDSVAACDRALSRWQTWSVLEAIQSPDTSRFARTDVLQPTMWALLVSLAATWRSLGMEPAAVIGSSQGEVAAACVAGALSIEDGAHVVSVRSALIARSLAGRGGGMSAVWLSPQETRRRIAPWKDALTIGVVNAPRLVAVAGRVQALDEFEATHGDDVRIRRIPVEYASHSDQVEPLREELTAELAALRPRASTVACYSTVTGGRIDTRELDGPYWYRNLRSTVRFGETVRRMADDGYRNFIEVSPHPLLLDSITQSLEESGVRPVTSHTLHQGDGGIDDIREARMQLVKSLS
jgi:acyl transferase domain-containing protein